MLRLVSGTLLLTFALSAFAEQPNYNYIEGGYQLTELDLGGVNNVDGDGLYLGASFVVAENWHVVGAFSTVGLDFGIDVSTLQVGGGFHAEISENASFYTDLLWVSTEVDTGNFAAVDDSGYGIEIGVRSNLTEQFEVAVNVSYIDFGNGNDGTAVGGEAWYKVGETFALGATVDFDEDVTVLGLGLRVDF